jgi:enolase
MSSHVVRSVNHRMILDSHAGCTTEYLVELVNGVCGTGSSSQGETISIYEDRGPAVDPRRIVDALSRDGIIGCETNQERLDQYLHGRIGEFGRNTCFALSLAFFDAATTSSGATRRASCELPRLCLNVLNGGLHAYTNPVFSDFSEFMIVPKVNELIQTIKEQDLIQNSVKERLLSGGKAVVNGNSVNAFDAKGNSAPIQFLVEVLEDLGLRDKYDLMIDASAGDLRTPGGYQFPVTREPRRTSEEMCSYWLELIETHSIGFLEDPFHEEDFAAWKELTRSSASRCMIIGDNLYSSDAVRIARGAADGYSTAAIVKPNQSGTVSATVAAIETARAGELTLITSHRSISTESTYVCDVTCEHNVPYIKIGPLLSDYSSVIRLNRLLRLSGAGHA